jgi:membrane-bound lytic murein transglycosylase MltF
LNERLARQGEPIKLIAADENLEDEDLMEMVGSGILPWAVVDAHKAKLWAGLLGGLTVREDLVVADGGELAWAIRKNSPQLKRELAAFVAEHKLGTSFGNDLRRRYFKDPRIIRNALAREEEAKFRDLVAFFRTYGGRFAIDPYLLAAQGYQESRFDQTLRNASGATGIMQIKPSTARVKEIGIDDVATRAEDNIHAGAKYLRYLAERYVQDQNVDEFNRVLMALAAYNAGPGNLRKFRERARQQGLDPNKWFQNVEVGAGAIVGAETVQYVRSVYKYYVAYAVLLQAGTAAGAAGSVETPTKP